MSQKQSIQGRFWKWFLYQIILGKCGVGSIEVNLLLTCAILLLGGGGYCKEGHWMGNRPNRQKNVAQKQKFQNAQRTKKRCRQIMAGKTAFGKNFNFWHRKHKPSPPPFLLNYSTLLCRPPLPLCGVGAWLHWNPLFSLSLKNPPLFSFICCQNSLSSTSFSAVPLVLTPLLLLLLLPPPLRNPDLGAPNSEQARKPAQA